MIRVPQTTECPDKTPQIHDLCSVLFDPATDHVINNGKNRNTQSEFDETISPRHKISGLSKMASTNLHGPLTTPWNDIKVPLLQSWQNRYYSSIWKPLSTGGFFMSSFRALMVSK